MMTRWLTLVLLICNLVVFARGYQAEKRPTPESGAVGRYPSLVLLREQGTPRSGEDERSGLPGGRAETEADRVGTSPEKEAGKDAKKPTDAPGESAEIALKSVPEVEPPDAKQESISAENSGVEPRSAGPGSPPLDSSEVRLPARFGESRRQTQMCYTAGPFDTRVAAEQAEAEFGLAAGTVAIREGPESVVTGYWVLIPALRSASEAVAEVGKIKAAGFKDVYRFTKGEMANAVSLGFFSRQEQALAHNKRVVERGFSSEVRPRRTEKTRFWLDWRSAGDATVTETDLAARAAESGQYTIEAQECP